MKADLRVDEDKPRSFTEIARRAQIVEEAIRAISQLGYANASLGQIAQRLGISKGVISYHFTNKDDLIEQVVDSVIREVTAYVVPAVEAAPTAADRLQRIIELNLSFLRTHLDHMLALREVVNAKVETGTGAIRASHRETLAGLELILREGQQRGEFRDFSPRVMAITIKAAIDVVPPLVASDPEFDLDGYAHELVELFAAATERRPRSNGRRRAGA